MDNADIIVFVCCVEETIVHQSYEFSTVFPLPPQQNMVIPLAVLLFDGELFSNGESGRDLQEGMNDVTALKVQPFGATHGNVHVCCM